MSLWFIIQSIFIGPLKLVFEIIYSLAYRFLDDPGLAIIFLSLAMNILVLPLYRRADAMQEQARDTENKLSRVVTHIKKTFSGDERMMILQAYYRQQNYSPLSALSGTLSLLLEIPFFMAAYQFLSGVGLFQGASLGPIADLSVPDGLITIGSFSVNLLPILMTVINVISSSLYLKGFPLKTKIQLYGMALFFLVFLYNSPAALVFYWTLNNTFALFKTLYYRIKNARTLLNILLGVTGGALAVLSLCFLQGSDRVWIMILGFAMELSWIVPMIRKKLPKKDKEPEAPKTGLFLSGAVFLTVLVGLLIPSTFISASTQEFISSIFYYSPTWFVIHTLCLSAGFFLVWLGVFYWLANPRGRVIFAKAVWISAGIMVVNYMFFGTNLGNVSPELAYTEGLYFSGAEIALNIAVIAVLGVGLFFVLKKLPKVAVSLLCLASAALLIMGISNIRIIVATSGETRKQLENNDTPQPSFNLSTEGNNVVVIMLDRALGQFIPYILDENPKLAQQLDGFTYYSQTMSYGAFTNFATPALYGGYDYTPEAMNARSDEALVDKHNEALKVVPTIMAEAGYEVTLVDPSYANYKWIPDLSIYEDIDGVTAYIGTGSFDENQSHVEHISIREHNLFFFSIMKTMPVFLQPSFYDDGLYHTTPAPKIADNTSEVPYGFMSDYTVLQNMGTMTNITNDDRDTYFFLRNDVTHEPVVLQEPDFVPVNEPDNSDYYQDNIKIISDGTNTKTLKGTYAISHYHANMAALIQLGNWFDSLREAGVYDNTRIIIVSDHGRGLSVFDQKNWDIKSTEFYQAMLLVKDFKATGFTVDENYMTNADLAALTMKNLIEDPVNPFTGNSINTEGKHPQEQQYIIVSEEWDIKDNNGTQYLPSMWATTSGDVRDPDNWIFYEEPSVDPPKTQD